MALQKAEATHKPDTILTEQGQIKPNLTRWPDALAVVEKMSAPACRQGGAAPEYLGKPRLGWFGEGAV